MLFRSRMLSYYQHDRASSFSFKLAGALGGKDVVELEQCWTAASSTLAGRAFLVDLSELTAVDELGRDLLSKWHKLGAEFVATSAWSRSLVESITGYALPPVLPARAPALEWLTRRAAPILWISLAALLFSRSGLGCQPCGRRNQGRVVWPRQKTNYHRGYLFRWPRFPRRTTSFHYVCSIGVGRTLTRVFRVTPRHRREGLIRGELWIDAASGIAVREVGRVVTSAFPRVDVIQDTDIREGRPYRRITHMNIGARMAGSAELTIIEHP